MLVRRNYIHINRFNSLMLNYFTENGRHHNDGGPMAVSESNRLKMEFFREMLHFLYIGINKCRTMF